jgi:glycosyltransferase involved in cell wall biosynthesis
MRVGVIVPVHAGTGSTPYLSEALEAVLSQEPAPAEVIVVDDGSPRPLTLRAQDAARCRLIRTEQRQGPGAARDAALKLLDTDLVACADADDVWCAGKLAAQLEALARDPEAALCYGTAEIVGADGTPTGERWATPPSLSLQSLYEHNPIPTSSVIARRGAVLDAGGFSGPMLCEDWALWLRMLQRGDRFVLAPDARIRYRRHAGGATADVAALAEAALHVHELYADLVDEPLARRVRAGDLVALARGRVRERRYGEAREALERAASLAPLDTREQLLHLALAVPGLRALFGRRSPYSTSVR